jgi:hypothetical protein
MDVSHRKIQKIFQAYAPLLNSQSHPLHHLKAIDSITHCHTHNMGVSYHHCEDGHEPIEQQHSCRHRSCYQCAIKSQQHWIDAQRLRLLDVPHFHVIFTLPHEYQTLWRYNEALFIQILFRASQQTLLELIGDKKYHGVTPGILMALHTWGRQLSLHPHTHCLVTAGGLDRSGNWQMTGKFLVPIKVVKTLYRGKVQAMLRDSFDSGELVLPPDMTANDFQQMQKITYRKNWSVRIEQQYEHGKGVMLYLARYIKGGPLNPRQIKVLNNNKVTMSYLDHRDKRTKHQVLAIHDFLKRILLHVPPKGVHTLRYYGLYAPSAKAKHTQCKALHGTLDKAIAPSRLQVRDMLLFCKTCGKPARRTYSLWRGYKKGISYIKKTARSGFAQQNDEPDQATSHFGQDP